MTDHNTQHKISGSDQIASSEMSSSVSGTHLKHCGYKCTQKCTCENLIKLAKSYEKYQQAHGRNISQNSDSFHSIILAGSSNFDSQKSSENSFHSAESRLPTIDSHESDGSPKAIEYSSTSCSWTSALNKNIEDEKHTIPENFISPSQSDNDLNEAQNLFTTTNPHNVDSTTEDEHLHYPLGNDSTTEFADIPEFLKSFSALSNDECDASKEVVRRLTRSFYQDPQQFANRLITIIEESETNHELEKTDISINKMLSAFLKMCKYIVDESMPLICNEISPTRANTSRISCTCPIQNIIGINPSSQETSTPTNSNITQSKIDLKISPLSHKKNISKTENSPLYISALKRAVLPKTPNTPQISESPGSTPGSTRGHNDSSFTFWEKKCQVRLNKNTNYDMPKMTDEEIERIAKSEQQLRMLQAPESPIKTPMKIQINPSSSSEYFVDCSFDKQVNENQSDITESILYELEQKRKRCFETEKTIRQIDAEASVYSDSLQTSENDESDKILKILTTLTNNDNYHKLLEHELGCRHQDDSGIDNRSVSQSPHKCKSQSKQLVKRPSKNLAATQSKTLNKNQQQLNITLRKPMNAITPRKKSPTVKTSRIGFVSNNLKYKKSSTLADQIVRSISPIGDLSTTQSSESLSVSQTIKTPYSMKPRYCTPNAKSLNLKVYSLSKNKSGDQLAKKTSELSVNKPSSSHVKTISNTPSRVKVVSQSKSNIQSSRSNKGFTLDYLNNKSQPHYSRAIIDSKVLTRTPSQHENEFGRPFIYVTPATPSMNDPEKSETPRVLKENNKITKMTPGHNGVGKYFNTPGKTPKPIIKKKKSFFTNIDNMTKPLEAKSLAQYHNQIKSPVAEYVRGTDMTLLRNVNGKTNKYLLTPKKDKSKTSDQLPFKLSVQKNNVEKNSRRNPIFDCEVESISDVNDENVNDNQYNHPIVSYQMPSVVHQINIEPNTPRGARTRRLLEANDNRVVTQHAGHAIPRIHSGEQLDMSIHVTKSAEKKKFLFQINDNKRN